MKNHGRIAFLAGLIAMLAIGWFFFPYALYEEKDQPLQFSHKIHTGEQVGMTCDDCHAFRDDGHFAGIPRLEKCAGCHGAQLGTTNDEKMLVDSYVTPGREIPWFVYARQPENVYFSHVPHVKRANIPCERCHGPHGQSEGLRPYQVNRVSGYSRDIWGQNIARVKRHPWDGMKMDDCAACHAERGVPNTCLTCHK